VTEFRRLGICLKQRELEPGKAKSGEECTELAREFTHHK